MNRTLEDNLQEVVSMLRNFHNDRNRPSSVYKIKEEDMKDLRKSGLLKKLQDAKPGDIIPCTPDEWKLFNKIKRV